MTNGELAILSLLAEQARHGYEIEQVIEARGMREWAEVSFSTIYYLLKKLEKAGLVEIRAEAGGGRGPGRKVYRLTTAGREAWHAHSLAALADPVPCRSPLQIGLSNLPGLPPKQVLEALGRRSAALTEQQAYLRKRREDQSPLPPHVDAMFDHSLALISAELGWIEQFMRRLENANGKD